MHKSNLECGDIVKGSGICGEEWYVVTDTGDPNWPHGTTLVSSISIRIGNVFGLPFHIKCPDENVPDEVWAALAAWRLTHA